MPPLLAQIATMNAQIAALNEQIGTLLARIGELEGRSGSPDGEPPKTPRNSSLPPSSAHKANRPDSKDQVSGEKKPRKSRPGVTRQLSPNPDKVRDIYAEACPCGARLGPADQPDAFAYDHVELPPIKPVTTRINLHKGQCPCCNRRVTAAPPTDMPPGSPFGPNIIATAAYLHACQMVSFERLTEVFDGLFGLKISEGAIANMLRRAGKTFATRADAIAEVVRQSPVIASDETSARVCGKTHWQWTFVAPTAVSHVIVPSRGKVVATEFLAGRRPKVWTSDRLAAQAGHADRQQVCLAHLLRETQYAIDAGDTIFAPEFKTFLVLACEIGQHRPELDDAMLAAIKVDMTAELDRLLELPAKAKRGHHLQCAIFLEAQDKLLVFLDHRDVEPTNNDGERSLRPSVIFRKVTGCFRSLWGAKVYADLRSIVATGLKCGRNALQSIREALGLAPAPAA
jgi:transposase